MKPSVLLFDLDNTLLGSYPKPLRLQFIWRMIQVLGRQWILPHRTLRFLKELRAEVETGNPALTNAERSYSVVKRHFPVVPESEITTWTHRLIRDVFKGLLPNFFPIPTGERLIQDILKHKKYRVVLATNPVWPLEIVEMRMSRGGLRCQDFEWVTHAENMHYTKRSVLYYQEVLNHLKVSPSDCLMIGDSEVKDGIARQLGIPVFLIQSEHSYEILREQLGVNA